MKISSSLYAERDPFLTRIRTHLFLSVTLLILLFIACLVLSTTIALTQPLMQQLGAEILPIVVSLTILTLLALLFVIALWHTLKEHITILRDQFTILEEKTSQLGRGDFSVRVPLLTTRAFRQLGLAFNAMATMLQQQSAAAQDSDILEVMLQLNMLLTSTLDFETLISTFQVKALDLLHLQLAVLYLYDKGTKRLSLAGAQGVNFTRLVRDFAPGEGMVGDTALSRKPCYIQQPEAAADCFLVKTLTGNVVPSTLYQLPLIQGDEMLGVLIFGSLYPMSEKARKTLNVVSSNFATVISHAHAYDHIREQAKLLARKNQEQEETTIALRIQRDELRVLNTALEEANQARNQFLSTMTHELRTPLTAILGFSQILLRDIEHTNSRSRSNVERILKNGQHLLNLMNDALDLVRLEVGHMSITITPVALPDLLSEVVEAMQKSAQEKQLQLETTIAPDLEEIQSDPDKLRQILLNLLSNALKFTEQGGIHISAYQQPATETEDAQIVIAIQDSGIGIPLEVQERIFDAFYQGDSSITRKYGGTGLGLSVVRQLTLLLGGTLKLDSRPGQGSTFTLFLPQCASSETRNPPLVGPYHVNTPDPSLLRRVDNRSSLSL